MNPNDGLTKRVISHHWGWLNLKTERFYIMITNQIWIASVLENKPYKDVRKIWKLFEKKYSSVGVQIFSHPHITFQGGKSDNLKELKKGFQEIASKMKPFEIEVTGIAHFGKKVIYLKVEKTNGLIERNKLINQFLKSHCKDLLEYYTPENWIPHVCLAMDDLTEDNFEKSWSELKHSKIKFKQKLYNICIVKRYLDGKVRIAKRYML
jgi:2'-5' RNA ligase